MTLKEAIESGKKIRRKGDITSYTTFYNRFTRDEVLADDWEILEEKILLSAQEISDVLADARISKHDYILKKLGFKDV